MAPWIVVLLTMLGCAKQYGSYVEVEGRTNQIDFDRVELHFGVNVAPATLATPGHQQGVAAKVFERQVSPADDAPASGTTRELDFYLTDAKANAGLNYVMAVAFAGDEPVGIGELFELSVPDDRTLIFHLALEAYDPTAVERWGRDATDCIAWTRDRAGAASTIAVVRADDHDCDSFTRGIDCDDASYCAEDGCTGLSVCGEADTCAIGTCQNFMTGTTPRTCVPLTCVIPGMCASTCDAFAGPTEIEQRELCGIGLSLQHGEAAIPTHLGKLCATTGPYLARFHIPNQLCTQPMIEYTDVRTPGFSYAIQEDVDMGCILSITATPETSLLAGDHHVMISFKPDVPGPRWSFVVGVGGFEEGTCQSPARFTPSGELSDRH